MALVPTTHTFADGVVTTSEDNSYIRDPIDFLQNKPMAELRQAVAQSIPATTWTALTWDTEDLDKNPDGSKNHSTSVNPSRFTAVYAGWYLCGGGYVPALVGAGQRGARWAVNGTAVNASSVFIPAVAATECHVPARSKRVYLNVSDYVELQVWQNSGGALNTGVLAESASSMTVAWDRKE